jgi:hypothetical protein
MEQFRLVGFNSIHLPFLLATIARKKESVLAWLLTVGFALFVVFLV